jgi:ABC-type transporter Mla subunit MlaD
VVLPGTTPPIASGAQVRVAGKIAGTVASVEPTPTTLRVSANLDAQYAPLGRGASIHVGVLLGTTLVYLVVNPGDYRHPLPPGTTIPESRVTLSSSLPQALETFDAATRRALARNIAVIGEGWVGRGQQTNGAIADQRYDYEQGTPLLRALLTATPGTLGRLIKDAATVSGALRGQRPDDVAAGTAAAETFWQTLARDSRAEVATARFALAEHQLLQTEPLADQAITAATDAARQFEPLALTITAEDPDFEALFRSAPSLIDATRRFNRYAPSVLRGLIPVLDSLTDPAMTLPLLITYGNTFSRAIRAYSTELTVFARQLSAVTSYTYAGKPAVRVTGTLACSAGRDPYPAPGQAAKDRRLCLQ